MSLEQLKKELNKLENGSALVSLLEAGITDKTSEINTLKSQLKVAKKVLGDDESQYEEKAQKLAEYDKLENRYNLLEGQYQSSQKEVATIKKDATITALCGKFNANKDALKTLLPEDAEITEDGIKQGDQVVSLKDYVANDPKMKIFAASIFPSAPTGKEGSKISETPANGSVKLPTDRGEEKTVDPVIETSNDYLKKRQDTQMSRLANRFGLK